MVEIFQAGVNRIVYQSRSFVTERSVTAKIYHPDLTIDDVWFLEIGNGFYYYDYNFIDEGVYIALMYEDGVKIKSNTFRVYDISTNIDTNLSETHGTGSWRTGASGSRCAWKYNEKLDLLNKIDKLLESENTVDTDGIGNKLEKINKILIKRKDNKELDIILKLLLTLVSDTTIEETLNNDERKNI